MHHTIHSVAPYRNVSHRTVCTLGPRVAAAKIAPIGPSVVADSPGRNDSDDEDDASDGENDDEINAEKIKKQSKSKVSAVPNNTRRN